jgi:hypothetical protein
MSLLTSSLAVIRARLTAGGTHLEQPSHNITPPRLLGDVERRLP